jgi:hypothetical protein
MVILPIICEDGPLYRVQARTQTQCKHIYIYIHTYMFKCNNMVYSPITAKQIIPWGRAFLGDFSWSRYSPRLLWNPEVHHRIHKSSPLGPNPSMMHSHHILSIDLLRSI